MRIAIISDIHSNIQALEAVFEDIDARGIDRIICAGDLVGYAPFPNEVIEQIKSRNIPTVMGNYDDGVGFLRFICGCDYKDENAQALGEASILWTKQNTLPENLEFLRSLPHQLVIEAGRHKVMVVHGSPRRLNEYLHQDVEESFLEEIFAETNVTILVCGHTHIPEHRTVSGRHLINGGSVGKPKDGDPRACYVILEFTQEVEVEFVRVAYDVEATALAIEKSGLPNKFAQMLRKGKS